MNKQLNIEQMTLSSFERSVKDLAKVFQGKAAFNYSHELELVMHLLMHMRNDAVCSTDRDGVPIHLTRIEWPCILHRHIDLVIWKPGSEKKARRKWGTQRGKLAKLIPLLAAVQVKRGGGEVTGLELTQKDLKDLEQVYSSNELGNPTLYFIEYVDDNLKEKDSDYSTYIIMEDYLNKWCNKDPNHRRAFLISRDGVGFVFPKAKWLINPLPKGKVESE